MFKTIIESYNIKIKLGKIKLVRKKFVEKVIKNSRSYFNNRWTRINTPNFCANHFLDKRSKNTRTTPNIKQGFAV